MPELQRLSAEHAPAVLAFELANRAYFSAFISDRGDATSTSSPLVTPSSWRSRRPPGSWYERRLVPG